MIQRAEDMREVIVERIDHLGIVAGIIKEFERNNTKSGKPKNS